MYLAIKKYLESSMEITKDLPGFEETFSSFQQTLSEIQRAGEVQSMDRTGFNMEKQKFR